MVNWRKLIITIITIAYIAVKIITKKESSK
jgi:hypothetical protein